MRTSIATVCLSGSLEEKMHACAAAGFDGIEIFEQDLVVSPLSPEEIRALAERLGLALELYQPFRDAEGVSEEAFADTLRRADAKFRLMARLGMDLMLVCSNVATLTVPDDDVCAAQLRRLGELAASHGMRIAYEALAWGAHVNTYRHAQRIVDLADHPAVGTCLDSFHILSRGDDPSGIEDIDPGRIFFVQLADAPTLTMDLLSWSRHYRLFPGQGGFDLAGFMAHLVRAGYSGTVSLEIFNDVFRQSDVVATARDARRSLTWLEDRTHASLGGDPTPMSLDTLPAPGVAGVDFVEVRTSAPEPIAQVLDQLGFTFRGQHRRKQVQLWVQGAARIIIDSQGAPGSSPRLSALGVQVDDVAAELGRAGRLRAPRVPRHHTTDEQPLTGVEATHGTHVFFSGVHAEPPWAAEFGPRGEERTGIEAVDHVNLAQPWQSFDESVLFYSSLLTLRARAATEVPSPMGLVRSQVLESEDRGIRLALNIVPQVLGSGDARIGRHHESSYPEHIALRTDDIVSVARRAREAGMDFLPIPQNYYDDLQARHGLAPAMLDTLRALDLLYDRDEHGEFLHFYTETLGGVFFEVVERRGYDGFGAPNAAVRLAAQFERSRRRSPSLGR